MAAYNDGKGISDNALAKALKMPQPTVTRHATGQVREAKESTLRPFAQFFNVSTAYLRGKSAHHTESAKPGIGGLSIEAIEVGRAWQRLDKDLRACFQQQILYLASAQKVAPWLVIRRPKSPHYAEWEDAIQTSYDVDVKQKKLDLEP